VKNKVYIAILWGILSFSVVTAAFANPIAIKLNFVDEDIRVILHTLATISNVDMVIDDTIKGNVTVKLKDVSFETAMNVIASAKGLSYRKMGDIYIIEPAEMGMTEIIPVRYTRVADIKKCLTSLLGDLKLKIEIDEISNSLIVSGSPVGCARVKTMLTQLDAAQPQVLLEAKVVAINKSNTKELGIDWSWESTPITGQSKDEGNNEGEGVIRYGRSPVGIPYEFRYQGKISALIAAGNAKLLANPKVTTISGKEAHIFIGDKIPVLTEKIDDGKSTTTITYVESGIKLTYTPSVTADGTITAKVHTEVSTASLVADIKNYKITTREAESNVCMKDGETMIIGGLLGSEESKGESRVPFLSDLPLLGSLFKSSHNSKTENEVIIFLTARIVK
jgi:type IV pilus assembly protein PilQ